MSKSISQIDWLKERQKGIGGSDVVGIHGPVPAAAAELSFLGRIRAALSLFMRAFK